MRPEDIKPRTTQMFTIQVSRVINGVKQIFEYIHEDEKAPAGYAVMPLDGSEVEAQNLEMLWQQVQDFFLYPVARLVRVAA